MHNSINIFLDHLKIRFSSWIFRNKKVLECGSLNINGSIRGNFEPKEYIGIDQQPGNDVDVVCLCHEYRDKPDGYFDVVVSCEMLEHDPYWEQSIQRMIELLAVNGSLIITCANPVRRTHRIDDSPIKGYYNGVTTDDIITTARKYCDFKFVIGTWCRTDSYFAGIIRGILIMDDGAPRLSIIINVLESYSVVNRQLLHFNKMDMRDCELVIIDDGSNPPLIDKIDVEPDFPFQCRYREDPRPWTTGAPEIMVQVFVMEYILMTDIDHILSQDAIHAAIQFDGSKMTFPRQWGVLTADGDVTQEDVILFSYGLKKELYEQRGLNGGHHPNTFVMEKNTYLNVLGGYDESLCGKYGGSDTNLNKRYNALWKEGKVERSILGPPIYVYPDPRRDIRGIFHTLRSKRKNANK